MPFRGRRSKRPVTAISTFPSSVSRTLTPSRLFSSATTSGVRRHRCVLRVGFGLSRGPNRRVSASSEVCAGSMLSSASFLFETHGTSLSPATVPPLERRLRQERIGSVQILGLAAFGIRHPQDAPQKLLDVHQRSGSRQRAERIWQRNNSQPSFSASTVMTYSDRAFRIEQVDAIPVRAESPVAHGDLVLGDLLDRHQVLISAPDPSHPPGSFGSTTWNRNDGSGCTPYPSRLSSASDRPRRRSPGYYCAFCQVFVLGQHDTAACSSPRGSAPAPFTL